MQDNIIKRLQWMNNDFFYYMATSDNDIPQIRDMVLEVDQSLKHLDNKKVTYYFGDFKRDTHYTLVTSAISRAFDKIFDLYKPLREKEINETEKFTHDVCIAPEWSELSASARISRTNRDVLRNIYWRDHSAKRLANY